jgi:hypothetical protein
MEEKSRLMGFDAVNGMTYIGRARPTSNLESFYLDEFLVVPTEMLAEKTEKPTNPTSLEHRMRSFYSGRGTANRQKGEESEYLLKSEHIVMEYTL